MCPVENIFLARAAKKCPKNMPEKFQGCAIFVPGKEGHSTTMNRHSAPRSVSLAALLRITCCCYGFMVCPRGLMAIQLLAAQKVGHLSLSPESPRPGPGDRDVNVHIGRKSVSLTSKALVTSFLAISF